MRSAYETRERVMAHASDPSNASTMEPAFIDHCRRGIDFARDIARDFMLSYQLPALEQVNEINLSNEDAADRRRGGQQPALGEQSVQPRSPNRRH
jgi:hypothetical protein